MIGIRVRSSSLSLSRQVVCTEGSPVSCQLRGAYLSGVGKDVDERARDAEPVVCRTGGHGVVQKGDQEREDMAGRV